VIRTALVRWGWGVCWACTGACHALIAASTICSAAHAYIIYHAKGNASQAAPHTSNGNDLGTQNIFPVFSTCHTAHTIMIHAAVRV